MDDGKEGGNGDSGNDSHGAVEEVAENAGVSKSQPMMI